MTWASFRNRLLIFATISLVTTFVGVILCVMVSSLWVLLAVWSSYHAGYYLGMAWLTERVMEEANKSSDGWPKKLG